MFLSTINRSISVFSFLFATTLLLLIGADELSNKEKEGKEGSFAVWQQRKQKVGPRKFGEYL